MFAPASSRAGLHAVLVATLACGDAAGPASVEGSYALESLNDSPLPSSSDS